MTSLTGVDPETWIRWISFAPIVACSVVGFALALWKQRQLGRPNLLPPPVFVHLCDRLRSRDLDGASTLVRSESSRAARLIEPLLPLADGDPARVAARAGQLGAVHARELEHGLGALGLVATLGPLFGLLGTVVGITVVFDRLAGSAGVATPQQLAGGIGTALYTTIAGLVVGVLALVTHRYQAARVDRLV
jgi:biopolymer transport protein ExbB